VRYALGGALLLVILIGGAVLGLALAPISLQELRDIVIVVYGVMGVLLLIALIVAVIGLWAAVRVLARTLNALLEDPVRPALDELRATAHNVRGTSEFVADAAVHPLIRVLAVARGVRRGVGRVASMARRR
jgi:hypothetical protein